MELITRTEKHMACLYPVNGQSIKKKKWNRIIIIEVLLFLSFYYYWKIKMKRKNKENKNLCLRSLLDSSSRRWNVYIVKLSRRSKVNSISPNHRSPETRTLLTLHDSVCPTTSYAFKGRVFCSHRVLYTRSGSKCVIL